MAEEAFEPTKMSVREKLSAEDGHAPHVEPEVPWVDHQANINPAALDDDEQIYLMWYLCWVKGKTLVQQHILITHCKNVEQKPDGITERPDEWERHEHNKVNNGHLQDCDERVIVLHVFASRR